jgi:hypothetical protein
MNILFVVLRITSGLASLIAFGVLCLAVFVRETGSLAKEGLSVLGYTTKLFASGFTEGTPPNIDAWRIGPWQIVIGVLSLAMLISVFTPGSRWFLHGVAALAVIVALGFAKTLASGVTLEIACMPFLIVWFGYYAMGILWQRNASAI